jgi:hypothetical protein
MSVSETDLQTDRRRERDIEREREREIIIAFEKG